MKFKPYLPIYPYIHQKLCKCTCPSNTILNHNEQLKNYVSVFCAQFLTPFTFDNPYSRSLTHITSFDVFT